METNKMNKDFKVTNRLSKERKTVSQPRCESGTSSSRIYV